MEIDEKQPHATPFEWIGGEDKVKALVDRFYDLMELEPAYAQLRAVHGTSLDNARQRLFWFLCGWLGGPQHYTDRFGHPMLRARHMIMRWSSAGRTGSRKRFRSTKCYQLQAPCRPMCYPPLPATIAISASSTKPSNCIGTAPNFIPRIRCSSMARF